MTRIIQNTTINRFFGNCQGRTGLVTDLGIRVTWLVDRLPTLLNALLGKRHSSHSGHGDLDMRFFGMRGMSVAVVPVVAKPSVAVAAKPVASYLAGYPAPVASCLAASIFAAAQRAERAFRKPRRNGQITGLHG